MDAAMQSFLRSMKDPLRSRLFLLTKLPAAWASGLRIRSIDENVCTVSVPYKWFTRNPFRSTYFACLSMAGEMSTGALAMAHLYRKQPAVSMLVVNIEGTFYKKAVGRTFFTCSDGPGFQAAIAQATQTAEPQLVRAQSTGRTSQGELIAEFFITWSFKARSAGDHKEIPVMQGTTSL